MSRRRHKSGYITLHGDGRRELKRQQVKRSARWTLAELVMLADFETHEVIGSIRWLATELGISRETLREHLRLLSESGWIEIIPGPNQEHETVIRLPRWNLFTGEEEEPVAYPVAYPVVYTVDQKLGQQTTSDLQEHAPSSSSTSSTSSTSRKGLKDLRKASPKKSASATEPWGTWTPREPWTDRHLAYVRLHLSTLDEGRLFRYAGELSRELWRQYELGRPPTREVCAVAVRDVIDADSRAREATYAQEKHRRAAEVEDFARTTFAEKEGLGWKPKT
jgi:hypothetical protein